MSQFLVLPDCNKGLDTKPYSPRRMYSELISSAISTGGPHASRSAQVKLMRSCKRVALKLIETFVEKCEDVPLLAQQIVPAMMDPILGDYARNVPDARYVAPQLMHRKS